MSTERAQPEVSISLKDQDTGEFFDVLTVWANRGQKWDDGRPKYPNVVWGDGIAAIRMTNGDVITKETFTKEGKSKEGHQFYINARLNDGQTTAFTKTTEAPEYTKDDDADIPF